MIAQETDFLTIGCAKQGSLLTRGGKDQSSGQPKLLQCVRWVPEEVIAV